MAPTLQQILAPSVIEPIARKTFDLSKGYAPMEMLVSLPNHPQHNDILEQVRAFPDDWVIRLVLADWYEENGFPDMAAGQRWQAKTKRRPGNRKFRGTDLEKPEIFDPTACSSAPSKPWCWYPALAEEQKKYPAFVLLPMPLYLAMGGWQSPNSHLFFKTITLAEAALWMGLRELGAIMRGER